MKLDRIYSIKFQNLSFSYEENTPILSNVNFEITKNQFVAFIGQSGSGKTSIIKLLLKFSKPHNGGIYINNIDINYVDTISLRKSISYVDQHAFLFNRTIYDNIIYNLDDSISIESLNTYIKEFSLEYFVLNLPNGLDTIVDENSSNLSGGEKQRLCIIRELLKQSDVIILDEYTSSLDSITESKIQSKIMELHKNKIIIMIAHKLSTVKNADMIYVLDNGSIIESGCHNELMSLQGMYFDMYNNQENNK